MSERNTQLILGTLEPMLCSQEVSRPRGKPTLYLIGTSGFMACPGVLLSFYFHCFPGLMVFSVSVLAHDAEALGSFQTGRVASMGTVCAVKKAISGY